MNEGGWTCKIICKIGLCIFYFILHWFLKSLLKIDFLAHSRFSFVIIRKGCNKLKVFAYMIQWTFCAANWQIFANFDLKLVTPEISVNQMGKSWWGGIGDVLRPIRCPNCQHGRHCSCASFCQFLFQSQCSIILENKIIYMPMKWIISRLLLPVSLLDIFVRVLYVLVVYIWMIYPKYRFVIITSPVL